MSVESKNSNIRVRRDGDKKGTGISSRMDVAPKELEGVGRILNQQRTSRDTTNHPSVELAKSGRAGAIQRRLKKSATTNPASSNISDSGSPDVAGDVGGDGSIPQN